MAFFTDAYRTDELRRRMRGFLNSKLKGFEAREALALEQASRTHDVAVEPASVGRHSEYVRLRREQK